MFSTAGMKQAMNILWSTSVSLNKLFFGYVAKALVAVNE
jgi:hypothetical protein